MSPPEVLVRARAAGVEIDLDPDGCTLHVRSQRAAADLWVPVIREHKWIIVAALKAEALGSAGQRGAL
jgi:hypothetical protein